jgi:hypothetical protein
MYEPNSISLTIIEDRVIVKNDYEDRNYHCIVLHRDNSIKQDLYIYLIFHLDVHTI